MKKCGYVYFMSNVTNNVLYVGVTSNLKKRILQHKNGFNCGFTQKYNCKKFVYFEEYQSIKDAILREKQIKGWNRLWKNELVTKSNKEWCDISAEILHI